MSNKKGTVMAATEMEPVALLRSEVVELRTSTERLAAQVETLSSALGALNQLQLEQVATRIRVEELDQKTVTKLEAEQKAIELAAAERRERRRFFTRIVLPLVLSVATLLFGIIFAISHSAHEACERRQEATRTVAEVLDSFKRPDRDNLRLEQGAERLRGTLAKSCDRQYPLHL